MKKTPQKPEPSAEGFDAVEMAAADWCARQEFGLAPAEQAEFAAWLRADPEHRRVFGELQQTSRVLERWPEAHPARTVPLPPAAASRPFSMRRSTSGWWASVAAAAVVLLAAVVGWQTFLAPSLDYHVAVATEVGELQSLRLPDGSTVQLNTDSALEVSYAETERRVRLTRGEASFSVAKHPGRPFVVDVGSVSVQAVGTIFNVRMHPAAVEVLVTEGQVRVDDRDRGESLLAKPEPVGQAAPAVRTLSAGHKVVVVVAEQGPAVPAQAETIAPAQIEQVLAWHQRRLKFEAASLAEVVREFNRYNRHKLVIDDPELAAQRFGGTFRPEGHETLIGLLEQSFDVVAERRPESTILRRRGS